MDTIDLAIYLADNKVDLAKKIKLASANELVYWEERNNPPNLTRLEFEVFLEYLEEGDIMSFTFSERESCSGKYNLTGLDWIFKFEVTQKIMGIEKRYFCKGFFFEKTKLRGVEIQSFREVRLNLLKEVK